MSLSAWKVPHGSPVTQTSVSSQTSCDGPASPDPGGQAFLRDPVKRGNVKFMGHTHTAGRFVGYAPDGKLYECDECGETFVRISPRHLSRALQDKGWRTAVTEDVVSLKFQTDDAQSAITVYREGGSWIIATPNGVSRVEDGTLADIADAVDRVATEIG